MDLQRVLQPIIGVDNFDRPLKYLIDIATVEIAVGTGKQSVHLLWAPVASRAIQP